MSGREMRHTGGPGSLSDSSKMSHFIYICCHHSCSEQTVRQTDHTGSLQTEQTTITAAGKGWSRKAPLHVCAVAGRRGNKAILGKGGRQILGGKTSPPKKVGKIISTQPCPHNCPSAGTLSSDLIPSRNYTGQDHASLPPQPSSG